MPLVGLVVGLFVGEKLGEFVGLFDGESVGLLVGLSVGEFEGPLPGLTYELKQELSENSSYHPTTAIAINTFLTFCGPVENGISSYRLAILVMSRIYSHGLLFFSCFTCVFA